MGGFGSRIGRRFSGVEIVLTEFEEVLVVESAVEIGLVDDSPSLGD